MQIGASSSISLYPKYNKRNTSFKSRFSDGSKKPKHIKPYIAYRDFARYNPLKKDFGEYTIPVHNPEIARHLKSSYTSTEFSDLFDFAKSKGTFNYIMDDRTGFVKTSLIKRKENILMSDMIWVTDTCNNMELIKSQHPEDCTKVLNKIADLYEGQKENFDKVIKNPDKYHKNGVYVSQGQTGVGHCFVPQSQKPHHWFARTRLESIGNYLQQSSDIISTGLTSGEYGYKNSNEIPDSVIDSIANCTKYLSAIHYPTARSCGAWEEQTFMSSLTSDTSICNQGIRDVMELMFAPTENEEILKTRERILNSKHGNIFEDKKVLEQLLKDGQERVKNQPDIEVYSQHPQNIEAWEIKNYERDYDSAMAFMIQTEKIEPDDIYKDSEIKLEILQDLEENLVRDNGAIRYKDDRYLNLDYHTLKNTWTDNKNKNEAEWFLVSEISCAYGAVAKQLLDNIEQKGSMNTKDEELLSLAIKGETEHINRGYARITPKGMTKSNRYSCPAYKVPEAYEAVTTKNGKIKYVPGAHNPLIWAEESLYKASELYLNNIKRIEKLN